MALKIIFAGTPEFACPSLQALLNTSHQVVAVYTQPDRPKGRGRHTQMSPIKQLALAEHLPVEQPVTLKNAEAERQLKSYAADLMVVAAYGLLLPQSVLAIPKRGCINVHASLLPRWRGAAPIQQAILTGDQVTGVTIMQMVAALDAGDILASVSTAIKRDDTSQTLHDRLARLGASLLVETIAKLEQGAVMAVSQKTQDVTYAPKITKQAAKINWQQPALIIERQVRAYTGWPVACTNFQGKLMRIWQAEALEQSSTLPPGSLIVDASRLLVACQQGMLQLHRLQLPGGRIITAADFLNAQHEMPLQKTILE